MKPHEFGLGYAGGAHELPPVTIPMHVDARLTEQATARKVWIVSIVAYLVLGIGTVVTRQPYNDEGELASPAYNLMHRGHLEVTVWEDNRDSHKAYWVPPLYFFEQAGWQAVVGFGVIQLRLATVLWGLILLFAVGSITRTLTGDAVLGALIAGALAIDYTFLMHAGIGRPEMMSLSLAILATAVYLSLRERSLVVAVLVSHTVMTSSGLTHPVGGMLWMPCLVGVQLWLDRRQLRLKHYALAALPYLVGGAAWGAYILQDPTEFQRQFVGVSLGSGRFAGLSHPVQAVGRELGRFLGYYGVRPNASWAVRLKGILPIGYLLGLTGALLIPEARRRQFVRACLFLLAVQLLILTFFEGTKQVHYIVHVIPTLVAILVTVSWTVWERQSGRRWIWATAAVLLIVIQVGPVLFRIRENRYRKDFLPTVDALRPFVEQKLTVVGGSEFAIPLSFPRNMMFRFDFGYRRRALPDVVVTSIAQFETNKVLSRSDPPLYRYMTVTFPNTFQLVFQHGDCAIYRRRS